MINKSDQTQSQVKCLQNIKATTYHTLIVCSQYNDRIIFWEFSSSVWRGGNYRGMWQKNKIFTGRILNLETVSEKSYLRFCVYISMSAVEMTGCWLTILSHNLQYIPNYTLWYSHKRKICAPSVNWKSCFTSAIHFTVCIKDFGNASRASTRLSLIPFCIHLETLASS